MSHQPEVLLVPRNSKIAELVRACADGKLPFSGPESLCDQVSRLGYKTTSLYEMVRAAKES